MFSRRRQEVRHPFCDLRETLGCDNNDTTKLQHQKVVQKVQQMIQDNVENDAEQRGGVDIVFLENAPRGTDHFDLVGDFGICEVRRNRVHRTDDAGGTYGDGIRGAFSGVWKNKAAMQSVDADMVNTQNNRRRKAYSIYCFHHHVDGSFADSLYESYGTVVFVEVFYSRPSFVAKLGRGALSMMVQVTCACPCDGCLIGH